MKRIALTVSALGLLAGFTACGSAQDAAPAAPAAPAQPVVAVAQASPTAGSTKAAADEASLLKAAQSYAQAVNTTQWATIRNYFHEDCDVALSMETLRSFSSPANTVPLKGAVTGVVLHSDGKSGHVAGADDEQWFFVNGFWVTKDCVL
jgi:hypothetical protein